MRSESSTTVTLVTTPNRKRALKRLAVESDRTLASLYEEGADYIARKYGVNLPPRNTVDERRRQIEAAS